MISSHRLIFHHAQAKELLDHLEDVLSNKPIEVISGNTIVEAKPQGVSKGSLVELICKRDSVVIGQQQPTAPGSSSSSVEHTTADSSIGGPGNMPAGAGAAVVAAHSLGLGAPAGGQHWQAAGGSAGGLQQQHKQHQQQPGQPPLPPVQKQAAAATGTDGAGAARGLLSGAVDFVLAVGDDRSDEDMFTAIEQYADTPRHPAEVRAGAESCHDDDAMVWAQFCTTDETSAGWQACPAAVVDSYHLGAEQ